MKPTNSLPKSSKEKVLLLNTLENDELRKYILSLKQSLKEGELSLSSLEEIYNRDFFRAIDAYGVRLSLVTTIVSVVRERKIEPPSLWVGILVRGGFI